MTHFLGIFVLLVFAHQLADQPLQNTWITKAKRGEVTGCPAWLGIAYHSFMHGALVFLVTGSLTLCGVEIFWHWSIDSAKLSGCFGQRVDQLLHLGCKALYIVALVEAKRSGVQLW
jgi:hypothetical protein